MIASAGMAAGVMFGVLLLMASIPCYFRQEHFISEAKGCIEGYHGKGGHFVGGLDNGRGVYLVPDIGGLFWRNYWIVEEGKDELFREYRVMARVYRIAWRTLAIAGGVTIFLTWGFGTT